MEVILFMYIMLNCSEIHKVQEEGVGQEIPGDELHWMKVGSTAGVISGLSSGAEKAGEDL
jgi:hypothetical protein